MTNLTGELSSCNKDSEAQKPKIFTNSLQEKLADRSNVKCSWKGKCLAYQETPYRKGEEVAIRIMGQRVDRVRKRFGT